MRFEVAFILLALSDWSPHSEAAKKLPSYITPCSVNLNLNECAKRRGNEVIPTIVKGDREYNIPVLDPLLVEEIRVEEGSDNSPTRLSLVSKEIIIRGLAGAQLLDVRYDLVGKIIHWDILVPSVTCDGRYGIEGKILILPIKGQGDVNIKLDNLRLLIDMFFEIETRKDGLRYQKVNENQLFFNVTGGSINLTNLFNGDRLLGDNTNLYLNENFQEILKEVGPAIGEAMKEIFKSVIDNVLDQVPFNEFYPDIDFDETLSK